MLDLFLTRLQWQLFSCYFPVYAYTDDSDYSYLLVVNMGSTASRGMSRHSREFIVDIFGNIAQLQRKAYNENAGLLTTTDGSSERNQSHACLAATSI